MSKPQPLIRELASLPVAGPGSNTDDRRLWQRVALGGGACKEFQAVLCAAKVRDPRLLLKQVRARGGRRYLEE